MRAVVYITDAGYLVPTLVSAAQASTQVAGIADVIVYVVGLSGTKFAELASVAVALGVRMELMEEIALPEGTTWKGNLSKVSLGRLLLPEYLHPKYRSVLYIDGDTQIVGDIRPLVLLDVPPGKIAASRDEPRTRSMLGDRYFAGLGIEDPGSYFNAGVIGLERSTLDEVMPKVFDFFLKHSDRCLLHDQSALNAVMSGRVFSISKRYNLTAQYFHLLDFYPLRPVILHFAGTSKPWSSPVPPWDSEFLPLYTGMIDRFPQLRPYAGEIGFETIAPPPPSARKRFLRSPIVKPLRDAVHRYRFRSKIGEMMRDIDFP